MDWRSVHIRSLRYSPGLRSLPGDHAQLTHLVSRVGNSLAVGGEGVEDLVGGLGPDEDFGVFVPFVDPSTDVGFEFGDTAVRGACG